MKLKKSGLSKTIGILLLIMGGIGFLVSLSKMKRESSKITLYEGRNSKEVLLDNTMNSGLTAIASALIILGGVKLIGEYTETDN